MFLRQLEPIQLNFGKLMQRQEQEIITEIHFIMRGDIHIGYNHKRFLHDMDLDHI